MTLACDRCGTSDFTWVGRSFALGFLCPDCLLVMCSACAGRDTRWGFPAICCYQCGSTGLRNAEYGADWLIARHGEAGPKGNSLSPGSLDAPGRSVSQESPHS